MPSRDILDKLLGVEQKAGELVGAASDEVAARIASAKDSWEASYKAVYEARFRELEAGLSAAKAESDRSLAEALDAYREGLSSLPPTTPEFEALCTDFFATRT